MRAPQQDLRRRKRQQMERQEIAVVVRLFKINAFAGLRAFLRVLMRCKLMEKFFGRSAE